MVSALIGLLGNAGEFFKGCLVNDDEPYRSDDDDRCKGLETDPRLALAVRCLFRLGVCNLALLAAGALFCLLVLVDRFPGRLPTTTRRTVVFHSARSLNPR
jgi:hypothetical protein